MKFSNTTKQPIYAGCVLSLLDVCFNHEKNAGILSIMEINHFLNNSPKQ